MMEKIKKNKTHSAKSFTLLQEHYSDTVLEGKSIIGAAFDDLKFLRVTFKNVQFIGCNFSSCNFEYCHFEDCFFESSFIEDTIFEGGTLNSVLIRECIEENITFRFSSIKALSFEQSNLQKIVFSHSLVDSLAFDSEVEDLLYHKSHFINVSKELKSTMRSLTDEQIGEVSNLDEEHILNEELRYKQKLFNSLSLVEKSIYLLILASVVLGIPFFIFSFDYSSLNKIYSKLINIKLYFTDFYQALFFLLMLSLLLYVVQNIKAIYRIKLHKMKVNLFSAKRSNK